MATILESLRQVRLMANLKKCAVEQREVLGYHLGGWQVRLQVERTPAIIPCCIARPKRSLLWLILTKQILNLTTAKTVRVKNVLKNGLTQRLKVFPEPTWRLSL